MSGLRDSVQPRELPAKRGEGELTLGFVLILTLSSPTEEAKEDKIKSNTKPKVKTPPVSAEKHRRASPLGEGAFKSKH